LNYSFGLGLILGPTLGGAFYELGGFIMPFAVLGIFLLAGGGVILLLMPTSGEITERKSGNFSKFISDFGIQLDALAIMTSLNFIGFNAATLEPHLRQFEYLTMNSTFFFTLNIQIF
jgi:MFS family permease